MTQNTRLPAVLAHLAAFAMASSRRLVTFDKGFRQFRGLELQLL